MEEDVDKEVRAAVEKAETLSKSDEYMDPTRMFDYLYKEIPDFLEEQRQEMVAYVEREKAKKAKKSKSNAPSGAGAR